MKNLWIWILAYLVGAMMGAGWNQMETDKAQAALPCHVTFSDGMRSHHIYIGKSIGEPTP